MKLCLYLNMGMCCVGRLLDYGVLFCGRRFDYRSFYIRTFFFLLLLSRWPRKIQQKRIVAAPVRGDDALII